MVSARAVSFVAPRRVRIEDVELPTLGEGDVLVKTLCSGVSSGTELLAYRGEIDPELPLDETIGALGGTFRFPFRYGYSCVGVVEASRSPDIAVGASVFSFQPHQDRFVAPATSVVGVGDVDPRQATLFPLVETALQITLDAGAVLADEVVLFGLGAVGLLTSALLQGAGARVVAVDPLSWRREAAAALGVTAVAPDDVRSALSPESSAGVPLVVEVSGRPEVLADSLSLLAHEGTALVASWYGTKPAVLPLGAEFHRRRLTIRSTQVSTVPARLSDRWTPQRRRTATAQLLGTLPLAVVATHTFPFDDAADAYAALDAAAPGLIHAAMWYG